MPMMRKLCCNAALYTAPALTRHDGGHPGGAPCVSQRLAAVIMLNSPASGAWEFEEYLRLHRAYRPAPRCGGAEDSTSCYFICADGAYQAMQHYFHDRPRPCADLDKEPVDMASLCDVIIGDMDSFAGFSDAVHAAADRASPYAYTGWFDTVDSVAPEVLRRIRARAVDPALAGGASEGRLQPILLPIACQLTTDFEKCLLLLTRLRAPLDGVTLATPQGEAVTELHEVYEATVEKLCKSTAALADGAAAAEEEYRNRSLLSEFCAHPGTPNGNRDTTTVVLPGVAVLGALGGRLDHELAVMSCVVKFATTFHVMVTNKDNVMFACWPDGVTQWLTGDAVALPAAQGCGRDGATCGIIPFGTVSEMETTGLTWNIVKGRPDRCDKVTQTESLHLAFDGVISACNIVNAPIVTVDIRRRHAAQNAGQSCSSNPPTLITCTREP